MTFTTVQDLVRSFPEHENRPCFSFKTDFRTFRFDYSQAYERIAYLVRMLRQAGVRKGDKVLIWAPNSPSWACSFLATACMGAVAVPMDFRAMPEFVARVAREVRPSFAFIGENMPDLKLNCRTVRMPSVWISECCSRMPALPRVSQSDLIEIVYTSGTTGKPKGVMLTHYNVMSNVASATRGFDITSKDKILSLLPLSHMFGQVAGLFAPLFFKGSVVYLERLNQRFLLSALASEQPSFVPIVPRILDMIKSSIEQHPHVPTLMNFSEDLPFQYRHLLFPGIKRLFNPSSFRCFISGGASLDPETERFFDRLGILVLQGYGLTETSPVLTFNSFGEKRFASVGMPIHGVKLKISSNGEILAKGPNITQGYYKNPEKTKELFADNWLATGDLGEIKDKFLFIKGRKKDLIVTSEGMNIYPEDVEAVLNKIKGVRDSAVVGIKSGGSEKVHAVLLLDKDAMPSTIITKANASLPSYSRITGFSVWPESDFPRTATMKVRKFLVMEWIESRHYPKKDHARQAPVLYKIISDVTKKPVSEVRPASNLTSRLGLASLDRVELLARIEDEMGVTLPDEVIGPSTRVIDLEKTISSKGRPIPKIPFRPWLLSWPVKLFRVAFQDLLLFPFAAIFTRTSARGSEHVKGVRGPLLIVCNHTSHADTPVLLMHLNSRLRERICPVAMLEYFKVKDNNPMKQLLMDILYEITGIAINMIPFPQTAGFVESMRYAGSLVDKGYSILVFPEGARSLDNEIHQFKDGVGMMAVNYRIPVLPIRVRGLFEMLPRGAFWPTMHPSSISFGKPFMVKSGDYHEAAREIEEAVRGL